MTYSPEEKEVWVRAFICQHSKPICSLKGSLETADAALQAFQAKFGKGEETTKKEGYAGCPVHGGFCETVEKDCKFNQAHKPEKE